MPVPHVCPPLRLDLPSYTPTTDQSSVISAPSALPQYPCAENGSCYGDISSATGRPKTVHVQGYWRRNGTYCARRLRFVLTRAPPSPTGELAKVSLVFRASLPESFRMV